LLVATAGVKTSDSLGSLLDRRLLTSLPAGSPIFDTEVEPLLVGLSKKKKTRDVSVPLHGADLIHHGDHIDVLWTGNEVETGESTTLTLLQNVIVVSLGSPGTTRTVGLSLLPEEGEVITEALHEGPLVAPLRNPEDTDVIEEHRRTTLTTVLSGERINALYQKRNASSIPCFMRSPKEPSSDRVSNGTTP
jgi:Flp pilus assembly protein CpaB